MLEIYLKNKDTTNMCFKVPAIKSLLVRVEFLKIVSSLLKQMVMKHFAV